MMEQGSVRNLEQIQETDGDRTPRGVTLLLLALGGACVVFAGLAVAGRRATPSSAKVDPLGELVTQQAKIGAPGTKATDLSARDVTFPGILSDEGAPTTALAAVKGGSPTPRTGKTSTGAAEPSGAIALNVRGSNASGAGASTTTAGGAGAASDTATGGSLGAAGSGGTAGNGAAGPSEGRIAIAPLPAQNVLAASPVVTRPRDSLTRAASDAAQIDGASSPAAPAGREGGYQLQVSSFRTQSEADEFATQLRARGHKAYVLEAHVPGRGTWYRVRIGPFSSQHAAASYRSGFEGREHVVPFIVPPTSK